ncbi:MAG: hypothetical protein IPM38_13160 [Ignavibacteria bacterium]|nr:hypothetical protein [Ignavibacteria bacterium]
MSGCRVLHKVSNNKLTALIETDDDEKPLIKIDSKTTLRFLLKSKNPSFINISALKIFDISNKIYYFSNGANNEKSGILYLSSPVSSHNTGEDYEVGSLIQDASDIYEAVVNNTSSPPPNNSWRELSPQRFPEYNTGTHSDVYKGTIVFDPISSKNYEALKFIPQGQSIPVTDTVCWKETGILQYVTSGDLIDNDFIAVSIYNSGNHADIYSGDIFFDSGNSKLYRALKFIERGNAVQVSDINFWEEVTDTRFVVSDDSVNINENIFGIIDLFFDDMVSENYKMLDSADKVKQNNFVIRFKNRITTWKYVSQKNTVTSLSDDNGIFTFDKTNNEFVSRTPIPLMASPMQNFKLITPGQTIEHIKCASALIKPVSASKSFLSEIFLNY